MWDTFFFSLGNIMKCSCEGKDCYATIMEILKMVDYFSAILSNKEPVFLEFMVEVFWPVLKCERCGGHGDYETLSTVDMVMGTRITFSKKTDGNKSKTN